MSATGMVRCYGWDGSRRRGWTQVDPLAVSGQKRRAFTLVELLVTVGIIALLVGILLPTITRAQAKAAAAKCKAQLHDIGGSLQMYLNANRDRYPLSPTLPSANPYGYPTIREALAPHSAEGGAVFRCPSDDEVHVVEQGVSYFYYAELGVKPLRETYLYNILKTPSEVPVLWDAGNYHGGSVPFNWLFADGHVAEFLDSAEAKTIPPPPSLD